MDDYLEFIQWMKQKYPNELGQGQGFGLPQGTGFTLPQAVPPQGGGGLGGVAGAAGKTALGMMNPWTAVGLYGGGSILKALMGDPMEKYRKAGLGKAQSILGSNPDVINVGRAIGQNRAAMIPQLGQMGEQFNKRFGLDTGMGQYANLQALLEKEGMFNLNAGMENDRLKSQRNQYLMSLLAGAR
jgi:hypothetical protein